MRDPDSLPPHVDSALSMEELAVNRAQQLLSGTEASQQKLYLASRFLEKHRCELLRRTLIARLGTVVQAGPFEGMQLLERAAEGCYLPKLLGAYEQELHPLIRCWTHAGYSSVVNIGCAEGFYAVGLARILPDAHVLAYDRNPQATTMCRKMATSNGLADRIVVHGEFRTCDLSSDDGRALVICDIEGAESTLFCAGAVGDLDNVDLLIETHTIGRQHTRDALLARFADTHMATVIPNGPRNTGSYPAIAGLNQLDQFLALWEWRSAPTPWLWLQARASVNP